MFSRKFIYSLIVSASALTTSTSFAQNVGSAEMQRRQEELDRARQAAKAGAAANAANQCATVWVGANGDGAGQVIEKNAYWSNLSQAYYARRSHHGGIRIGSKWSGEDRSWTEMKSATVKAGCTLSLHATEDGTDTPSVLNGTIAENNFFGPMFPMPGNVHSLKCDCGTITVDSSIGFVGRNPHVPK